MSFVLPAWVTITKKSRCHWLIALLLFAAVGVGAARTMLGSFAVVMGTSMAPTLASGDTVFSTPITGSVDRGDVVILKDDSNDYAIKRVVGLPGETVYIWRGYVYINGRILIEPYVPKRTYTFPRRRNAVFKLGPEQYFVLGDNRPCSADSRQYGPVDRGQLKKRVQLPETAGRAKFGPLVVQPYGTIRRVSAPDLG